MQYLISEICIRLLFEKISTNFNIRTIEFNSVYDFYVGQRFSIIEIIGQNRVISGAIIINVNVIDEYVTVCDDDSMSFRIDKYDIHKLRFIP